MDMAQQGPAWQGISLLGMAWRINLILDKARPGATVPLRTGLGETPPSSAFRYSSRPGLAWHGSPKVLTDTAFLGRSYPGSTGHGCSLPGWARRGGTGLDQAWHGFQSIFSRRGSPRPHMAHLLMV